MKLFTKIFLQVACVILLLSSGIFFYTTYKWKNQSIQDINNYEDQKFQNNISQFEKKLSLSISQPDSLNDELRKKAYIYAFRQTFHDTAALYQYGEELYNGTAYEFQPQEILKLMGDDHRRFYDDGFGGYDPIIRKTNGRTLLLFSYSSMENTANMNYEIVTYKDVTNVLKRNQILFYQAGILTLILLFASGTILFFSLRSIMSPLGRLNEAAICVSRGDYDIKVPTEGATELTQVGQSFNLMTAKVKEQIDNLSSVNQAQRQLLGSLAHELKTPMTAIIGYADTLLTVRLSPERQEKALTYIGNECRRLSRLSVKMLELTGLYETGESQFFPGKVQVEAFLKEAGQLSFYRLKEKNITLEISCAPSDLTKTFDKDLMLSLITNFIDNAIKASPQNSVIFLTASVDKLMVQDFGKGIPAEDLKKVTEAFYMVDKSRSRANGSVGLGLALCQKIADIHGYTLKLESREGEGTRAYVLW